MIYFPSPPGYNHSVLEFLKTWKTSQKFDPDFNPDRYDSLIGKWTTVGNIAFYGVLRVKGAVKGSLKMSETGDRGPGGVVIVQGAFVEGDIEADHVHVHGTVKGNISAGSILIGATGSVEGNLTYDKVTLAEGSLVRGTMVSNRAELKQYQTEQPVATPVT